MSPNAFCRTAAGLAAAATLAASTVAAQTGQSKPAAPTARGAQANKADTDKGSPSGHLRAAGRAMNESLSVGGSTGDTRAKLAQLYSYYNTLDLSVRGRQAGYLPGKGDVERPRHEWQHQYDGTMKLLDELLGPPTPGGKPDAAAGSLRDERIRAKLREMRMHLQQFNAAAR